MGEVLDVDGKKLTVKVHNAIYPKDSLEIIGREKNIQFKILSILNSKLEIVESAHGGHGNVYYFEIDKKEIKPFSLIRKIVVGK